MIAATNFSETKPLSTLFAGLVTPIPSPDLAVGGLCLDSREVQPGDCFFGVSGGQKNGAAFVDEALRNGAVAVAVETSEVLPALPVPVLRLPQLRAHLGGIAARFYESPSERLALVAITGTNGKTTVAHLCAETLDVLQMPCGYIGTLGIGAVGHLQTHGMTTPDPFRLQATLADMLAAGKQAVALEASSHALAQDRLAGSRVKTAVFTGLGHDHLDYHASRRAYFEAKQKLFQLPGLEHAVINADDPVADELLQRIHGEMALTTFSLGLRQRVRFSGRHLVLSHADYTARHSRLDIETGDGVVHIESSLIGDINAQNLLATLGVLLSLDIALPVAAAALAKAHPVTGRLERFGGTEGLPLVFIDYAHSPDSLERVLRLLKALRPVRLWCVFGCGGERDHSKRPLMGQIAAQYADRTIVTDDNPRGEKPSRITADILQGTQAAKFEIIHDRVTAINTALSGAAAEDIVLIAGKGHETFQELRGMRLPQSDQTIVKQWLSSHA